MQKLECLETAEQVFKEIYFGKCVVTQEHDENDQATKLFNNWFAKQASK